MLEMYKGVANSPETTITNDINNLDTIIYVLDETRIPELPNIMVLGTGISAETVKVLSISGTALTVERGFQGVPKNWNAGTIIARNFTEYDYDALVKNIKELNEKKTKIIRTEDPPLPAEREQDAIYFVITEKLATSVDGSVRVSPSMGLKKI